MPKIPPINLEKLENDLAALVKYNVAYGLGAKASPAFFKDPNKSLHTIKRIDCSGYVRLGLYRATGGKLLIPDGSWYQREWCEKQAKAGELNQVGSYADINRYMTEGRLFICFIKPYTNGCGAVGHVWLTGQVDGDRAADTLESHGGAGPTTRNWDAKTLRNQFFSGFELPTTGKGGTKL